MKRENQVEGKDEILERGMFDVSEDCRWLRSKMDCECSNSGRSKGKNRA